MGEDIVQRALFRWVSPPEWTCICDACNRLPPWYGEAKTIGVPFPPATCPLCGAAEPKNPARWVEVDRVRALAAEMLQLEEQMRGLPWMPDPLPFQRPAPQNAMTPSQLRIALRDAVDTVATRFGASREEREDMMRTVMAGFRIEIIDGVFHGEAGLERLAAALRERLGCHCR